MSNKISDSATIKDVADKAGVSTASVSYVLNGQGKVAEKTAHRIRKVMLELEYTPRARRDRRDRRGNGTHAIQATQATPAASQQALPVQGQILFLAADARPGASRTYQMQRIVAGAEAWMDEFGLETVLGRMGYSGNVPLSLKNPELTGVILRGPALELSDEQQEALKRVPCVEFFDLAPHGLWDQVSIDNVAIAHESAAYFKKQGCDRVVILNPDEAHEVFHLRATTLEFRLQSLGIPCERRAVRSGERLANTLPTADGKERLGIFIAGYNEANHPVIVEKALIEAGLVAQQDVVVIGASPVALGHPTIFVTLERLGQHCAEQLIWRIQNPDADTRRILMQPALREATHTTPHLNEYELN